MSLPPVIAFTPVPLRRRADGWSPDLQRRFIVALSRGLNPGEAAHSVGKNRQNAYALRHRPGAESFAAAWDEVVAHVQEARIRGRSPASVPSSHASSRAAPPPFRPPSEAEAVAIAERGAKAIDEARTRVEGRRALDEMLDALYGPKSDNSDTGGGKRRPPMGSRN